MRNYINYISYFLLILSIGVLTLQNYNLNRKTENEIENLQKKNDESKIHTTIYYDQVIESLKKTNESLYDSIKGFKDKIDYLVKFNYKKDYEIKRLIKKNNDINIINNDSLKDSKTFEYNSDKNDTLNYSLMINSIEEPNWYKLKISISDKFTLLNKKIGETNELDIKSDNKAEIDNVTVFNKKKKRNIFDRFAFGPSISVGYDLAKKETEFMVGVSLTYNILGK